MKRLSINFAWHNNRTIQWIGILALCISVAVTVWIGSLAIARQQALEILIREREAAYRSFRPAAGYATPLSPDEKDRRHNELKMAQSVIERLDMPWDNLFIAIESAFDDQVALLNVEPEPERRGVRLVAEAKDLQTMQAYLRQLRRSPALQEVYLASHQINQQEPLRPVRFSASARWIVQGEHEPPGKSKDFEAKTSENTEDKFGLSAERTGQ